MNADTSRYVQIISGRAGGPFADMARAGLTLLAILYRCVIFLRNQWYARLPSAVRRVGRPVVSVGNLTVGGTGKTPLTAKVAELLLEHGRRTAILSRGYKRTAIQFDDDHRDEAMARWSQASDESAVLKRRCPRAMVVLNPNRVAGAEKAIESGAECLVLDDGFQHRRLGRDVDIVLIDATLPFGYGRMLPRGLLREPIGALRRASLIILTRSNEVDDTTRGHLMRTLTRVSGGRPVLPARHRIVGFVNVKGRPVDVGDASAMQAVIFAGIGNFASFRRSVERLGVRVLAAYRYPDHHYYTAEEIEGLKDAASAVEANVLLTTEKDAVKLVGRWPEEGCRLLALHVEVELDAEGDKMLARTIDRAVARWYGPLRTQEPHGEEVPTG